MPISQFKCHCWFSLKEIVGLPVFGYPLGTILTDSNFDWDNKILPFTQQEEYSRPAIELGTARQILDNHSINIKESDRIDFLRRKNDGLNTSVSCDVMGNDWIEDRTARRCWFSMAESEDSELCWGRTLGEILEIGHGLIGRPVHSRYDLDLFIEKHTHSQADPKDYNINTVQIIADFFGIAFDDPKAKKLCRVRPCVSVLFIDYFFKYAYRQSVIWHENKRLFKKQCGQRQKHLIMPRPSLSPVAASMGGKQ